MEENKLKKFNKIYPWYTGLSGDLLFWIAIDTLFLTVVKKFTASQIVSLTSISMIINILLQVPLLKIIHKIGNTKSVRLGSFLLLISSILLTFGRNYLTIVMGKIFYEIAFTFQNMINAVLKNNLKLQNKEEEYIRYRTNANTIYAAVTMAISFVASFMFNINNYLPMICCIIFCVICFILSLNMIDYSKENDTKISKKIEGKIKYTKIIVFIVISYGLFFPIVNSGQSNGKLFIQQELLKLYDVEKTSLIIGAILCVSRIVRLLSNIKFDKIHKKYEDKVGIMLTVALSISLVLMLVGYNISNIPVIKFAIMSLGYVIILFIRDPFKDHVINGYNYIKELEYDDEYANICLTHSYLNNDIDCTAGGFPKDISFRTEFIKNHEYTIYEKIINLCDLMCTDTIMTVDKRLIDLIIRKGAYENTQYHIKETYKLKQYIDEQLRFNVYDLFPSIKDNL